MKRKWMCMLLAGLMSISLAVLPPSLSARAEDVTVLTSFYPVYILSVNLLNDVPGVTLENLAAPDTGCLHDYQLLPGDMRALSKADALLVCGAGMESYLNDIVAQMPTLRVINASVGISLIEEQAHHHDGEEEHEHEEEAHETAYNAHIWLSVPDAMTMVNNIAQGLSGLLPASADIIEKNRAAYTARLEALDTEIRQGLENMLNNRIVTFHEAFPYFAREYGLEIVAVVTREHDDALSPAEIAELIVTVRENGNPPLFTEPQYSDMAAETVAAETGAHVYTLDPLVTGELTPDAYEQGMRDNLRVLREALGAADQ